MQSNGKRVLKELRVSIGRLISRGKQEMKRSGLGERTVPVVCLALLTAGGLLAAHIISNQRRIALEFSRFRISSNYLEEGERTCYTVGNWGDGFDILLYNYEKEDTSQTASVDMSYKVTAENGEISVRKQSGETVNMAANSTYTFAAEQTASYHVLHVTPDAGKDDAIIVTVQTTSPYQKTLTAEFQVQNYSKPEYTLTDQNNGTILLTVHTNDYQDSMTVTWEPEKYSPDHDNELTASWSEDPPIAHFPVSRDSTYELLFRKKTDDPYPEQKGSATVITLD